MVTRRGVRGGRERREGLMAGYEADCGYPRFGAHQDDLHEDHHRRGPRIVLAESLFVLRVYTV